MSRLRVGLAQLNVVVGDLHGNVESIIEVVRAAESRGCDLVAFSELAITGYPPEDLLLKPGFIEDNLEALDRIVAATGRCVAIVGYVARTEAGALANAVAVCADGALVGTYHKRRLPNYAVFDERRYFATGTDPLQLYEIAGAKVGVSVCEDAWTSGGPIVEQARGGAELVVNVNASPYHAGKVEQREAMLAERASEAGCAIAYVNQIGGQDELVFDGASLVVDAGGTLIARADQYREELFITDLEIPPSRARSAESEPLPVVSLSRSSAAVGAAVDARIVDLLGPWEEVFGALVLGTRDYVRKNGFAEVLVGLSGGIDSALVAAVAAEALGADRVHGVLMPSRFSSDHSITDAIALADNLGIEHRTIAIEPAYEVFLQLLAPSLAGRPEGITQENLQPRIRGTLLMALSNEFDWMVLTTGNKSETAVGYTTLYGDMAGGFAVLQDVPKTWVFEICRDLNARAGREVVPEAIITKAPSAELRAEQFDTDSLPPYEVLDAILADYVERDLTTAQLIAAGHDPVVVRRVTRLVDRAEHKRRQGPPGIRVTTKAFGKDRRLPITNRYGGEFIWSAPS